MSKPDRYKKRLKDKLWVQWEIVRRHEDYINFCDKQEFDDRGELVENTTPSVVFETVGSGKPQNEIIQPTSKTESIKKRYFLNEIYHYSKDISEDDCLDVCGWGRHIFPIWPESENFNAKTLPQYGEFIYLGINIAPDVTLKDIEDAVLSHVSLMRHARKASREQHIGAIKEKISKLQSQAITQSKELQETGTTTIDPIIEKLQEKMLDIEQGPSQTTPGKDQKLDYYKELFQVWDLYIEGKAAKEIIEGVWCDEYENEFSKEDDSNLDKLYKELSIKYREQGIEDHDERAYSKAYGYRDENMESGSGSVKLFMRVKDKINRMKELFNMFPET